MLIQPSPVRSDDEINYKFNKEQILATISEDELLFNLSNIELGKEYEGRFPISEVKRNEKGILEVNLIQYHGADATKEERFPDAFESKDEDFKTEADVIQLNEIVIEESPDIVTENERLKAVEDTLLFLMME